MKLMKLIAAVGTLAIASWGALMVWLWTGFSLLEVLLGGR